MNNNEQTTKNFYDALEDNKSIRNREKKFFIYFKDNGAIVSVSPIIDTTINDKFKHFKTDMKTAYPFISGELNPGKFLVKKKENSDTEYELIKKTIEVKHLRYVENFLTQVTDIDVEDPGISIKNDHKEKTLKISIKDSIIKEIIGDERSFSKEQINVNGISTLVFYFTLKDCPYFLIHTVTCDIAELIYRKVVSVKYKKDLKRTSLFCKKIFNTYKYTEIN